MAMEKHIGTSAGLLALLALLFHSMSPGTDEKQSKSRTQVSDKSQNISQKHATSPGAAQLKQPPNAGPWLASREYFHAEPPDDFETTCIDYLVPRLQQTVTCDRNALLELFGLEASKTTKLETLIVTIPDPLHTRLSVKADRDLDAVQEGAFAAGWELATQWLPWTAKAREGQESGSTGPEKSTSDLEQFPGLIVFRHQFAELADPDRLLFVFVVGETPTAGIDGFEFTAAVRAISLLHDSPRIKVLGPSFSGSFISLTQLIESDPKHGYTIRSGAVANSDYASKMLGRLSNRAVTFHGSSFPSLSFDAQFHRLAERQRFYGPQVAQLVETESGFSVGVAAANKTVSEANKVDTFTYRYPRDIAQLRDAYSDLAFSPEAKSAGNNLQPLQFSLKDPQSGEDSFPVFSTTHTPVSQNTVVEQIASDLNRRGVRLVALSASNIFDTLFLTNVLKKQCPDLRIVVSGADLLFAEEAAQHSLGGLLAISTYPMFSNGFRWANDKREDRTFPDADSVGEYNAAVTLLNGGSGNTVALTPALGDSSLFSSAWELVLSRDGWAPVDLLDESKDEQKSWARASSWFGMSLKPDPAAADRIRHLPLPPVSNAWTVLCLLIGLGSFAFLSGFVFLRFRPNVRSWSIVCSIDLLTRSQTLTRVAQARYLCLSACFASLLFLNGILLIPMMNPDVAGYGLRGLLGLTSVLLMAAEVFLLARVPIRRSAEKDITQRYLLAILFVRLLLLIAPLAGLYLWMQLCFGGNARGHFFSYRVLSLTLPICPLWPVLLCGAGLFTIAVFHLRRLTWVDRLQPALETSTLDQRLWGMLCQTKETLDRLLSGPAHTPFVARVAGCAFVVALLIALWLLFPEESLRSFEPRSYENVVAGVCVVLSMLVTAGFTRFWYTWRTLRNLLTILNSLVVGQFFRRLPDFEGGGPVWIRDLKLMSLGTSVNSAIALHNLALADDRWSTQPMDYWQALDKFLRPKPPRSRSAILEEYKIFANQSARITRLLSECILRPHWLSHPIAFVQQGGNTKNAVAEEESEPKTLAVAAAAAVSAPPAVKHTVQSETDLKYSYEMASQYVALQYSVFIGYALRHVQNLLLCCVLSFVFLVLALNSFSFQAPQAISRLTIVALFVGGFVVVRVLAQIERNPIVSRISGTEEGALGWDFYLRVVSYGALPVLTVLATQFPSVGQFLTSWAAPTLEALK
jgi:hypothetical protein